jgi:hypothetical protein
MPDSRGSGYSRLHHAHFRRVAHRLFNLKTAIGRA